MVTSNKDLALCLGFIKVASGNGDLGTPFDAASAWWDGCDFCVGLVLVDLSITTQIEAASLATRSTKVVHKYHYIKTSLISIHNGMLNKTSEKYWKLSTSNTYLPNPSLMIKLALLLPVWIKVNLFYYKVNFFPSIILKIWLIWLVYI